MSNPRSVLCHCIHILTHRVQVDKKENVLLYFHNIALGEAKGLGLMQGGYCLQCIIYFFGCRV